MATAGDSSHVEQASENHEFGDNSDAATMSSQPQPVTSTGENSAPPLTPAPDPENQLNSGVNTKKKAQPVRRPAAKYKVDDLMSNIVQYMLTVLLALETHDTYNNPEHENSEPLQAAAATLRDNPDHPTFVMFCKNVGENFWAIITCADHRVLNGQTYDQIINKFQEFRVGLGVQAKWNDLLRTLKIKCPDTVTNVLLQYCLRTLFQLIMKERNQADLPVADESDKQSTPLSSQDHQVIHYISGYIPFSLIKTLRKSTKHASKLLPVLQSWRRNISKSKDDDFVSYVNDWMTKQNRGYLFQPNWDLHVFFRTLEYVGRKYLHASAIKNYIDTNLHEILTEVFTSNKIVQERWCALVKDHDISSQASDKLFNLVISKWIKTRCTAYVKVYIDIRKRKDKNLSKKGEKALRKQVDKPDKI